MGAMAFAIVFPGQGSQRPGMGRGFFERSPAARGVFARVSDALGWDAAAACFSDDPAVLASTGVTQPALFCAEAAALAAFREAGGGAPACAAGHSLGEYTALYAAGALTLEDGVRLVATRGRLMAEAAASTPGAMAAVLGSARDDVATAIGAAGLGGTLWIASRNAPGQGVVSGGADAVDRFVAAAKGLGFRKVVRLNTAGAFHSPLMEAAAASFAGALDRAPMGDAAFPVVTNAGAAPATTAARLRADLARQMTAPVLWEESVRAMAGAGATAFVELGPGTVLAGLIGRTVPGAATVSVEDPGGLDRALDLARRQQ